MNRRGFFSRLALVAAAASVSPHIFIPKFEPVHWKVARAQEIVFNPADYVGKWVFENDSLLELGPDLNWFYDHIKEPKRHFENTRSVFPRRRPLFAPDFTPLG